MVLLKTMNHFMARLDAKVLNPAPMEEAYTDLSVTSQVKTSLINSIQYFHHLILCDQFEEYPAT